jgi:hypothetical protein
MIYHCHLSYTYGKIEMAESEKIWEDMHERKFEQSEELARRGQRLVSALLKDARCAVVVVKR